jgi:hypothetical protein
MTDTPTGLPRLYTAAEVAAALRRSPWWVKEQARHLRIPHCWIGGSYRFTEEHVAEIARLFERRPAERRPTQRRPAERVVNRSRVASPIDRSSDNPPESATVLRARTPRRARLAATRTEAA